MFNKLRISLRSDAWLKSVAFMSASRLSELPFLSSIEGSRSAESRRIVLRVLVDMFTLAPTQAAADVEAFENAARSLIATADAPTRLVIARKLSLCARTPPSILEELIDRGGDSALHVLQHAVSLPGEFAARAISRSPSEAAAIARRRDLDAAMILQLALRPEREVALALAANGEATLDPRVLAAFIARAAHDRDLAVALLSRGAPGRAFAPLFLEANSAQRLSILAAEQRVDLGQAPRARGEASPDLETLEHHALARRGQPFIDQLAAMLDVSADLARRIATDPSGEPLIVALAALDAPGDVALRILLSADLVASEDGAAIAALARLKQALGPGAARRVIAAIAGDPAPAKRYKPVFDPRAAAAPGRGALREGRETARERSPAEQAQARRFLAQR
jgi:hypothetical protein